MKKILSVTDPEFKKYGKVVTNIDFSSIVEAMQSKHCPKDGTVYVASDAELESLPVYADINRVFGGEMEMQVGYCNGHNLKLNGLEYHRNSEVNICATDCIFMLGFQQDIEDDFSYDTSNVEAFLAKKGTAVEFYATSLHYAPCHVSEEEGFRACVVLPKKTNWALEEGHSKDDSDEDRLLMARNKWLIVHKDGGQSPDAFVGLQGANLEIGVDFE